MSKDLESQRAGIYCDLTLCLCNREVTKKSKLLREQMEDSLKAVANEHGLRTNKST